MKSIIPTLKILTAFFSLMLITYSCAIEQSPINYGKDACIFCKMNIVDNQHAAEIVTKKGKPFKYDAIECMMEDIKARGEETIALFLITDYTVPGKLVDAKKSTYLISENFPSPMGANLTGFESKSEAEKMLAEKGGKLFTYEELIKLF